MIIVDAVYVADQMDGCLGLAEKAYKDLVAANEGTIDRAASRINAFHDLDKALFALRIIQEIMDDAKPISRIGSVTI
jgi:hypothetical protein